MALRLVLSQKAEAFMPSPNLEVVHTGLVLRGVKLDGSIQLSTVHAAAIVQKAEASPLIPANLAEPAQLSVGLLPDGCN